MPRAFRLIAFAAGGGGLAACALVSGLKDYSAVMFDGGEPVTMPKDARSDAVADDGPSTDDASDDAGMNEDVNDGGASNGDADGDAGADGQVADANGGPGDANDGSPPVDANDANDANDAGPPPDASEGGCTQVVHSNGEGQTYTDCVPKNTYGLDEAAKACAAANAGSCATQLIVCGPNDTEIVECATVTNASCTCWAYQPPNLGRARKTALTGSFCQCPTSLGNDPTWN
jgi:hypothetical protein